MATKKSLTIGDLIAKIFKIRTTQILVVLLIVAAFFIGALYTKVENLKAEKASAVSNPPQAGAPQAPQQLSGSIEVSIDDDPILGDKNAKVTVIDFSDYECPFCKKYFDETFSQIKKDYIDTGKLKYVYRDLPLSFHQNAHKEAQAAECARGQGGDGTYFKYHDEIFKRTISNGTGLALDQLQVIANDIGLNGSALQSCLDSEKYKAEVDKDLADASAYGATGTPSFFIGKSSSSDKFKGTILVGAQPFAAFKTIIDEQLK